MNRKLSFYDYPWCFDYYTDKIMNLRHAKIHGVVIVAKPVLMLALIDGIDLGVFTENRFVLNEWLEERYLALMKEHTSHSQFSKPADISNPFWHLATDGFWHLQFKDGAVNAASPSKAWLKENVDYATFDDDLWVLLQNQEWRTKLHNYIVEQKLSDGHWFDRLSPEFLTLFAAILLVA